MSNPFKQQRGVDNKPKRNNFDLSNQNHLTMDFGYMIPFLCLPTVPGDSYQIESAIGLKFQPLTFPVQTRMRAHVSYFYVPCRILWDEFKDWITGLRPNAVHPYLDQPAEFYQTGTLADYMGVPTSVIASNVVSFPTSVLGFETSRFLTTSDRVIEFPATTLPYMFYVGRSALFGNHTVIQHAITGSNNMSTDPSADFWGFAVRISDVLNSRTVKFSVANTGAFQTFLSSYVQTHKIYYQFVVEDTEQLDWTPDVTNYYSINESALSSQFIQIIYSNTINQYGASGDSTKLEGSTASFTIKETDFGRINQAIQDGKRVTFLVLFDVSSLHSSGIPTNYEDYAKLTEKSFTTYPTSVAFDVLFTTPRDTSRTGSPFVSDIRLNALPFRAYEAIRNAYFRNTQVDPFKIDGVAEYNRFVTNDKGGADSTPYELFKRQWQLDAFTSALPSPQQGPAPLIGMSNLDTMQITTDDGEVVDYHVTTAEDGQTIIKLSATSPNATNATNRIAMNVAQAGIAVNDIRNVNSLQRWLETNIRRGYHYKDFISGHHGVSPSHVELNMPEFLGGYTRDVTVNSIQNVAAGEAFLGEFAGTAGLFSGSSHKIHKFCDDYGYIIGLVCVTPDPVYSQNLAKDYLKSAVLDYYFPEFANLGMQPITYEELTPVQRWMEHQTDETKKLTDTFGYQRPNYDMIYRPDEAHGDFRASQSTYLIHRLFAESPELGADFINVDEKDCKQVFTVQTGQPILGQIINSVYAKRPVPRVTIPRLE